MVEKASRGKRARRAPAERTGGQLPEDENEEVVVVVVVVVLVLVVKVVVVFREIERGRGREKKRWLGGKRHHQGVDECR